MAITCRNQHTPHCAIIRCTANRGMSEFAKTPCSNLSDIRCIYRKTPWSPISVYTHGATATCAQMLQVKTAEGFSKRELFEKLAPLEEATRPLMATARHTLGESKGPSALQPWNISYSLSGASWQCSHHFATVGVDNS